MFEIQICLHKGKMKYSAHIYKQPFSLNSDVSKNWYNFFWFKEALLGKNKKKHSQNSKTKTYRLHIPCASSSALRPPSPPSAKASV